MTSRKFADYFVICGLDINSGLEPDKLSGYNLHCSPLERSYKTNILAHYPDNIASIPFDESAVSMLALPNGLRFRTQKHPVTQAPLFHPFVVTRENGSRYYGFSLVFYEEVRHENICQAMHILQSMFVTEVSSTQKVQEGFLTISRQHSAQSRSLPRHFKVSTTQVGMPGAYYDIAKDKLFVTKSIVLIGQHSNVHAAKIFLENLYKCVPRRSVNSSNWLSLESYVFHLLNEVELPSPGKSILVHFPPSDPLLPLSNIILQNPAVPRELPHLDFPIRLLFMWLGVDIVLDLFTCMLLEHQILFHSTDCHKLMVVAECMTVLLFPFSWPHVYVPILPLSLHHFLDAPVPFIMGMHTTFENFKFASEATLCFVDIDKCKITLPEEIVKFPQSDFLTMEIISSLDKYGVHCPNTESVRIGSDNMSRSCTLPGKTQFAPNRRKLSIHDNLDIERPPSPPGSARTEALQRIADIVRRTGVSLERGEHGAQTDSYQEDLRLNNSIREIFFNRFVHIFQSYENFVIFPNQDRADWFNNRESMQNFDKASFLSDQPEHYRRFLSRFLESQMFATLIDNKILSTWDPVEEKLHIFDYRIKLLKQRQGGENMMRSTNYEPCTYAHDTQKLMDTRFQYPEFESSKPKEVLLENRINNVTLSKYFPILDKVALNKRPVANAGNIPRANYTKKLPRLLSVDKLQIKNKTDSENKVMSPALIAQNNWTFVEKLLKDCKTKTKRMLLAKLGQEGVTLSNNSSITKYSGPSFDADEESTLVASLCDFLERVWSHGVQRRQGKSAIWTHLLMYQEAHSNIANESLLLQNARISNALLLADIRAVQMMNDVKTGIGMARAWIRLTLEKKQLSRHLRILLTDQAILRTHYKRSAFIRCDEEKEQFLYHLLSLNAVDYFCFTSTYPSAVITYRIEINPMKKGTTTSANSWVVLSGTLSETKRVILPKSCLEFEFKHSNLGVLTTMRIGHDNSGMSAKWMIDFLLIRNEITGHIYKFPCGRWLGRGVDDGSTERLLVGHLIKQDPDDENISGEESHMSLSAIESHAQGVTTNSIRNSLIDTKCGTIATSSMGRKRSTSAKQTALGSGTSSLTRSVSSQRSQQLKPSQIQNMLGDCVNSIVKWHYRRSSERQTTLTALLCGDNGLVNSLEQVFLFGFKSARLFVFNHYLWDYFVRVKEQFEIDLMEMPPNHNIVPSERITYQETVAVWRCYCHLIDEINQTCKALGKDGKFQLFICLSVREHLLHRMLIPMANCKVTMEMYEDNSFLRNRGLLTFLRQILLPLDELDVVLESSVTNGIPQHM